MTTRAVAFVPLTLPRHTKYGPAAHACIVMLDGARRLYAMTLRGNCEVTLPGKGAR
ncbi:hypothetical protein [Kribbella sp. NPDC051137]|uniref:hypothetical protein n=1 Tax=Kribbella sp. NPDC051137 TaxID=3155045 RepID=UPI002F85A7F7